MFRIVCDPSSGIIELYLTEILSGSLMFVVCLVGVWQRNFEPVMCVYSTAVWERILEFVCCYSHVDRFNTGLYNCFKCNRQDRNFL